MLRINIKTFFLYAALILFLGVLSAGITASVVNIGDKVISAEDSIVDVKSYGSFDKDGIKLSAIIIEYDRSIDAESLYPDTYEITFCGLPESKDRIKRIYVNDKPKLRKFRIKPSGRYVIIEVDGLSVNKNLASAISIPAEIRQEKMIISESTIIAGSSEKAAYCTISDSEKSKFILSKIH